MFDFYRGCSLTDVSTDVLYLKVFVCPNISYLDKLGIDDTFLGFLLFRLYPVVYALTAVPLTSPF